MRKAFPKDHYYIFENKVYDLKDWVHIHPGGSMWFINSYGRDLTSLILAYHTNPTLIRQILSKYETSIPYDTIIHKEFNVPPFILPPGFDASKDMLKIDWTVKNSMLDQVRKVLSNKDMQARIKNADFMFDLVGFLILLLHTFMSFYGVCHELLPPWLLVLFFVCSRTSLAGVGHYHNHRKKDGFTDWGDAFFDMQYVGASTIAFDGHSIIHHSQTNSLADVKRTVFTGITELPRVWRIPAETMKRFGHLFSGQIIRWISIPLTDFENMSRPKMKHFWVGFVRIYLFAEFVWAWYTGYMNLWIAQFIAATWINLFLIVSSHDFEEGQDTKADLTKSQDWAKFQIDNSVDMYITGNQYVDCYLTAGLGCHRVHHLLPYQKSGFSNIISVPAVQKVWEDNGYKWMPTQSFLLQRLPKLFYFYVLSPPREPKYANIITETLSLKGLLNSVIFAVLGFAGFGSI